MANSFELTGTLKVLEDPQTFASGFSKREFVIEVPDGKYPQLIKFGALKDKASLLDSVSIGDELTVTFDVRGREYNGNYYVDLNAWKVHGKGENKGDQGNAGNQGGQGYQGGGNQSGGNQHGGNDRPEPSSSAFDSSFDHQPEPSDDDIPF